MNQFQPKIEIDKMCFEMLYLSPSINGAIKKVKTGVQNMMADAFPRGTILTPLNMAAKRTPPNKPWTTVRTLTSFGPKNMFIFGSSKKWIVHSLHFL